MAKKNHRKNIWVEIIPRIAHITYSHAHRTKVFYLSLRTVDHSHCPPRINRMSDTILNYNQHSPPLRSFTIRFVTIFVHTIHIPRLTYENNIVLLRRSCFIPQRKVQLLWVYYVQNRRIPTSKVSHRGDIFPIFEKLSSKLARVNYILHKYAVEFNILVLFFFWQLPNGRSITMSH